MGDALAASSARSSAADHLGRLALGLTEADRALLDLAGRHPFLPLEDLTTVLGWPVSRTRWRRNRLIR